ncbi:hypothetical protein L2E82_22876 [Cichorium intybus]|uniref:Uncharacterized protein n=1 Tax=Cichorium intybus TaxID=13427 RepID=A0ACB9DYZ4_CICIN|nr:hypothetical protein L2E82_22876 [Cichorium intybus]
MIFNLLKFFYNSHELFNVVKEKGHIIHFSSFVRVLHLLLEQSNCYTILGVDDAKQFRIAMNHVEPVIDEGDDDNELALAIVLQGFYKTIALLVRNGSGRPGNFPLTRQGSIYSLTFDELQNTMGSISKDFGSMNMDELLKNIWNADEMQTIGSSIGTTVQDRGGIAGANLQRQGSLTLPRTLSPELHFWFLVFGGSMKKKEQLDE